MRTRGKKSSARKGSSGSRSSQKKRRSQKPHFEVGIRFTSQLSKADAPAVGEQIRAVAPQLVDRIKSVVKEQLGAYTCYQRRIP